VPANLLFDFYTRFGPWFTDRVLGGRLLVLEVPAARAAEFSSSEFTSALFMDFVYEESIELVGATALLAGVLMLGKVLTDTSATPVEPVTTTDAVARTGWMSLPCDRSQRSEVRCGRVFDRGRRRDP